MSDAIERSPAGPAAVRLPLGSRIGERLQGVRSHPLDLCVFLTGGLLVFLGATLTIERSFGYHSKPRPPGRVLGVQVGGELWGVIGQRVRVEVVQQEPAIVAVHDNDSPPFGVESERPDRDASTRWYSFPSGRRLTVDERSPIAPLPFDFDGDGVEDQVTNDDSNGNGATGAPVEDYSLDVGYREVNFSPNVFRMRERAALSPAGQLYTGIVPGELTLDVQAEGWPLAHATVDALAPGETRDVTVTLSRGASLHGRVVDRMGRPLAGIPVQVTRGPYPGHDSVGAGEAMTSGFTDGKQFTARIGYRDDATTTAADGSFTFDGLGQGTHALLALRGLWNDAATTVELPRTEPVVLSLSDAALTTVRMRLPEGESFDGLALQLGMARGEQRDAIRMVRATLARDTWTCDAAGLFAARHLPVGAVTFEVMRASDDQLGRGYEQVMRHEAVLNGTEPRDLELDLRESFPVRVTLRAPQPEVAPDEYWTLNLNLVAEGAERSTQATMIRLSDLGQGAQIRWAAPGVYRVKARAPGIQWSRPEPVQVVRGAANVFELAVPLVGREVRVLSADGALLAATHVAYWTDPENRAVGTTDADGALIVVLLEGSLSLALLPPPAPEPVRPVRRPLGQPRVDPQVLAELVARATAAFGPGEGALELRLCPE